MVTLAFLQKGCQQDGSRTHIVGLKAHGAPVHLKILAHEEAAPVLGSIGQVVLKGILLRFQRKSFEPNPCRAQVPRTPQETEWD